MCIRDRNRIEGEARFLRGAYYYLLVNLYANPYVKETASTDMGVPLNLTEDSVDEYYKRNSMEECYRVIVEDLKADAEKLKGVTQPTIYRAVSYTHLGSISYLNGLYRRQNARVRMC